MALRSGKGASITLEGLRGSAIEKLYSEAQSGVVVTLPAEKVAEFEKSMSEASDVPYYKLGVVNGDTLSIDQTIAIPVSELKKTYDHTIPAAMRSEEHTSELQSRGHL